MVLTPPAPDKGWIGQHGSSRPRPPALALGNQLASLADLGYGNDRYKLGHHRRKWSYVQYQILSWLGAGH